MVELYVLFNTDNMLYRATMDNNVYSPTEYPQCKGGKL